MTLDDTLTAARPVTPPSPATLGHGRADLIALTHADISRHARLVRQRTRRRVLGGATLAAAATCAFLILPHGDGTKASNIAAPSTSVSHDPIVEVTYANAAQVLSATATAAGLQSALLGDAPYWKVVSQDGADESRRRSVWIGVDGPGVMPFPMSDTPAKKTVYRAMPQATIELGGHTYTWRDLNGGALAASDFPRLLTENELANDDGSKSDRAAHEYYFFKEAYEVLARTPASPAIRQKLWDAVADIAGVELDGKVTDSLGRTGWAVSLSSVGQGTQTYVVDPTSGALLESRGHAEGASAADGWVETFVESGPADSAPKPISKRDFIRQMGDS